MTSAPSVTPIATERADLGSGHLGDGVVPASVWRPLRDAHEAAIGERTDAHIARRMRQETHPVEDFLFTYYPFKVGQLKKWHPGPGVRIELLTEADRRCFDRRWYRIDDDRKIAEVDLDSWRADRGDGAKFIASLLASTLDREANFGCFGIHEWAMVYRLTDEERRHQQVPLRLSPAETDAVVEGHRIQCSHHDAFRFFTAPARPLNTLQPSREGMVANEQPGCLHAGMDLYKWAMKISPIADSALVVDCFDLALDIRTLDMEASPYDLRGWGYGVVAIETAAGKAEYMVRQKEFSARAQELRRRLLEVLAAAGVHPR
ncbi:3-methyladenine DNA glycosylase [Brevibacterium oceani]|uniref:3-methyladenine DNA glycosylase n=1 Tax=Brevibacterium oceani TaxID=358099 RepID=UPI001FE48869|nr:3-methyladenine DNA glycosylase [Brevibacterium oceani]